MQTQKRLTRVLAMSLLAATIACEPAAQQDGEQAAAVDTAAILATFDSLRTSFEEAFAAGDLATMVSYYDENAVLSEPGVPPLTGRQAIRSYFEENALPEGATLEIEPTVTRVLTNDWVYEMGVGTMRFTPEGADEAQEMPNSFLAVFHRTPDGWKIVNEVLGSNAPPPSGDM